MANLYITEQNSVLRKTGDRLIVQKEDEILLDVQCHKIDAVLIFGNVQFTTQAVHELFEHGIEMAILTRTGRLVGQITSPTTRNIFLRIEQFKKYGDENFKMDLSRTIIAAKIKNGLNLVRHFSYNHPEIDFKTEISGLNRWINKVNFAENNERLLGLEGSAAKLYYTAFGKMILGDFDFSGRKKRPPPDPVNAMLSLSYTMIFNEIASLLDGLGFDPYLGFFHRADYGRASLAADLVEEFRAPIAEHFVLNLINGRTFTKEDFKINPKGARVSFRRDAMKRYFSEYEKFLNKGFDHPADQTRTTLRKCIRRQAENLAAAIQNNQAYMPFELKP